MGSEASTCALSRGSLKLAEDDAEGPGPAERIARLVADRLGPDRFARFFASDGVRWAAPVLEVRVRTRFAAQFAQAHYRGVVEAAAAQAGLAPERVEFIADDEAEVVTVAAAPAAPAAATPIIAADRVLTHTALSDPRWSLAQFVVGAHNRLAFEAVSTLASGDAGVGVRTAYVHGCCGVGKTHLLHGAAQLMARGHPSAVVRVMTGEHFANAFILGCKAKRVEPFRRHVRAVDLLVIDDVGGLLGKAGTLTELQHTLDAVQAAGGRVLLSGPDHPRRLAGLGEAVASRLLSGLVAEAGAPDAAAAADLIQLLAARRGLRLDASAARSAVAHALKGAGRIGVRDLEGLVLKLQAMSRLMIAPSDPAGRSATLNAMAVERALGPRAEEPETPRSWPGAPRPPVPLERLIGETCRAFGVDTAEVRSTGRREPVVLARAMAAHLAVKLNKDSFPTIGQALGRRGHSTALSGAKRIGEQIRAGATFRAAPGREPEPLSAIERRIEVALGR